jgi:hypothetical protein
LEFFGQTPSFIQNFNENPTSILKITKNFGIYWTCKAECLRTIEIDFLEVIQENLNTGEVTTLAREDYNVEGYQPDTYEAGL